MSSIDTGMTRYYALITASHIAQAWLRKLRYVVQLREQVNYVRMVMSPPWRGPGNIQAQVTAEAPHEFAFPGVRIITSVLWSRKLTTIACGWLSLITDQRAVVRRSS